MTSPAFSDRHCATTQPYVSAARPRQPHRRHPLTAHPRRSDELAYWRAARALHSRQFDDAFAGATQGLVEAKRIRNDELQWRLAAESGLLRRDSWAEARMRVHCRRRQANPWRDCRRHGDQPRGNISGDLTCSSYGVLPIFSCRRNG